MEELAQQLINGLGRGSQYAIWAVGYGLIYQLLRFMHFAHGDTIGLATFVLFSLVVTASMPVWAALIIVLIIGAVIALAVERAAYRPLIARGDTTSAFITALGAALILRNFITLGWGRSPLFIPQIFPIFTIHIGAITFTSTPLYSLSVATLVVVFFVLFIHFDKRGQAILAISQDLHAAVLVGIPIWRIVALVYAISGIFGVVGAVLYINSVQTLVVSSGFMITLKAFTAALIGGLGRLQGAIIGGLVLGLFEALVVGYISSGYRDAIVFGLVAVVILLRPEGLVGKRTFVRL